MNPRLKLLFAVCLFSSALFAQEEFQNLNPGNSLSGIPPTEENCNFYKLNENWLPDAFINNATCACQTTPDEEKANIIRKLIQEQIDAIPVEVKVLAAQKKQDLKDGKIRKHAYKRYVKKELSGRIHHMHVAAYDQAGCKGNPARKWAWKLVTVKKIKNCKTVWFSIRCLGGSCSACLCKW